MNVIEFCICPSFPFGLEGGMWEKKERKKSWVPPCCLGINLFYQMMSLLTI